MPDTAGALDHLISIDLSQNQLEGPVPLSWLQADGFLSHVFFLNVDSVCQGSVALTSWRQQLCLKKNLCDTDVTGQSLALLPKLAQSLPDTQLLYENDDDEVQFFSEKDFEQAVSRQFFFQVKDGLQFSNNQLVSVRDICANHGSRKLLLIAWLLFGACCLTVVAVYICAQCVLKGHDSAKSKVKSLVKCPCFWATSGQVYRTFSGLGMLAFYHYDLVTSIVVLGQVWGTWPGGVLMTVFLVHFATGAVVLFHGLYKFAGLKNHLSGPQLLTFILGAAVVFSPLMIPIVLVLDTLAFVRQVLKCAKQIAALSGFWWSRPRNLAAVVIFGLLHRCHYFGLRWVDLEEYESMHNLIAAVLQSIPTVVLNSVLFSLGNKPSHGVFLPNGLFVAAIAASCLVTLKCLVVVLWQAFRSSINPIRLAVSLIVGQTLAGVEDRSQASDQVGSIALLVRQYELSGSAPLSAPV